MLSDKDFDEVLEIVASTEDLNEILNKIMQRFDCNSDYALLLAVLAVLKKIIDRVNAK